MIYRAISKLISKATVAALVLAVVATPLSAFAVPLTISENGPYVAVDSQFLVGAGEWRAKATATALPNANGTPANVSLLFAYSDAQNYYYANYAVTQGAGLSGVYKVTNGIRTTVGTYANAINANQAYDIEVRHKEGAARVYLGSTMLYKATNVAVASTKLGVGTIAGNATINGVTHELGTVNTVLNVALIGSEPVSPTPPTVQLTSPSSNATVSGTQTVSATAGDSQGISAVQFQVNGNNLGAADTTAPYSISWDTSAVANGAYTLTAIATNIASLSTQSAGVAVNVNNTALPPTPPSGTNFSVDGNTANAGIDTTHSTAASAEWRISTNAVATANTTTPANFSVIFGYVDAQNYYYVNFAAAAGSGLSGVYRVTNGTAYKVLNYSTFITPGSSNEVEVRYKDNGVRIYLNGVYVTKASGLTNLGSYGGVGTLQSAATFTNTALLLGSNTVVATLGATTLIANPENLYACLPIPSSPVRVASTGRQVAVSTSAELKAAILDAQPGDVISLADGTYQDTMVVGNYNGSFALTADGTAAQPITLIGSRNAIIDGNGVTGRYGLYLNGAQYWNLVGFSVKDAAKGIVLDGSNHVFIEDMLVSNIGDEAIHFRAFSSDNVVKGSEISYTGQSSPQFGEGVYIGSASGANWGVHSGGAPDTSDRNVIINNSFHNFAGEGIDVKEGSSKNYIAGNTFEGSAIAGQNSADSWVDVKGNCNFLENNTGTNTLLDGFQVHNAIGTWGSNNLFRNNTANVNAAGYGVSINYNALNLNNLVECNNTVVNAGAGAFNVPCVLPPQV